jgi:hypothetical protein
MSDKARKLLEFREGRPESAVVGDGGQSRAVDLSHRFPGGAVEGRVFEGLFLGFVDVANGALVALSVCRLGRKGALARSHLMYARSLEYS